MMDEKNLFVLTSGGDAPGMNMALLTLAELSEKHGLALWGIGHGLQGALDLNSKPPIRLTPQLMRPYALKGGTWLGSSRCPEFKNPTYRKKAFETLRTWSPQGFFILGGEGSYRAAELLAFQGGFRTLGIPCSIDNDVPGTETSIGFFSALEKILRTFDELKDTGSSHERIMILEVMGNACSDLAVLSASISECIHCIAQPQDVNLFPLAERIKAHFRSGARVALISVAEKSCDVNQLAQDLSKLTGHEAKAEVLGHIQRGGEPVAYDRLLAKHLAEYAMERILLPTACHGEAVGILKGKVVSKGLRSLNRMQPRWPAWFKASKGLGR